jgi:predicted DsbA family dithiol-disulfide isomerase
VVILAHGFEPLATIREASEMAASVPISIEVFSDITCPFTHVGLERVVSEIAARHVTAEVRLRAWPLEWVNGVPLDRDAVVTKAAILTERLGVDSFEGLGDATWPTTTLPALELTAAAYGIDSATGLAVGLAVRSALFRDGLDIADPAVLAAIADEHDVEQHTRDDDSARVRFDYADGRGRGVRGSPHYWSGDDDFFCPALVIGHDDDGTLTADFDPAGLTAFLDSATGTSTRDDVSTTDTSTGSFE